MLPCFILRCLKKLLPKELDSYGKNNSTLMSHASHKVKNVKFSTGSLGHGLPYMGKALVKKLIEPIIKYVY